MRVRQGLQEREIIDIVERLRNWADDDRDGEFSHHKRIQFEAAAEITRLRAEAEALRKALQQLIEYADTSDDCQYGTLSTSLVKDIANAAIDATKGTT